jgi:hypothetical protein
VGEEQTKRLALKTFQPKALRWLGFKVNLLIYNYLPFLNAAVGTHEK